MATFYHAHVAGFTKHADSIAEVQTWLDSLRGRVVGETLKVWRVVDCLADATPCIHGPVTGGDTTQHDACAKSSSGCAPSPQGDRQMKAQMHDFMDGKGPVPSHIHTKGGGWVADTANVHNSAYIGPDARVHGSAWVSGDALVKRGMF